MKSAVYFLISSFLLVPFLTSAASACSSDGYTVATINGVFTDEGGAIGNMAALKDKFGLDYRNQKIDYQYFLNPSHLGGIGDLAISVYQKAFESETVLDYDLVEMLKDASAKVKTQKLLIVAHSQGNFYANSFYDTVADKEGGVPAKSIGIYSVANPASRVAGGGKWMTSDTDHVIAGLVQHLAFFRKIMPTNEHIAEVAGGLDPSSGHDLTNVYLKYRSTEIVKGIQESMSNLSDDPLRSENTLCIDPPKLSIAHKIEGAVLAVADPVATVGVMTVVTTAKAGVFVAITTVKAGVTATVWTYHTTVAVAVWGYDTSLVIGKFVGNTAVVGVSIVYDAVAGVLTNKPVAGNNNTASVILATQSVQNTTPANKKATIVSNLVTQPPTAPVTTSQKPQTVFVFEPKVQSGTNAPKLVFVGSFGSGGATVAPSPQVLGVQTTAQVADEVVTTDETVASAGAGNPAPALSAPQCAQTLATDGCLLATTTVHFEWSAVEGADHYLVNKNDSYSTTTETVLDTEIKDFSDYTFEVVAVGANGTASATSTQKVSVATIPIAINEIAWMGTKANWRDEWFEIKNNTSRTIDLSQWELNSKDSTPYVKLTGTIEPHGYLVFERKINTVDSGNVVQATSTLLNDHGDQMTLFRDSVIFDQTPDGAWVAGATSTRQTMERYSSRKLGDDPENWGTNLGYIKNGKDTSGKDIEGTPGEQNSVSTLINKGQDITSDFTLTADEERYVVPDSVWVEASTTLTIEPGVTISFLDDPQGYSGYFIVKGEVDARGTSENPIVFNSFSDKRAGGFWVNNAAGTSTFEHTRFENINNPIDIWGGALEIRDSEFINTDGGVESYGEGTTVLIKNTSFASSTSDTIRAYGSNVRIASSTIINQLDDVAIGASDGATMTITSTTIDGVLSGGGIYAYGATLNIASSTVRNTSNTAISLAYSTTTIANSVVQGGELNHWTTGIDIAGGSATITGTTVSGFTKGAGISVSKKAVPGIVADISSSEITGNAIGIEMEAGSTTIAPDVSIQNNTKNIVTCPLTGECVVQ